MCPHHVSALAPCRVGLGAQGSPSVQRMEPVLGEPRPVDVSGQMQAPCAHPVTWQGARLLSAKVHATAEPRLISPLFHQKRQDDKREADGSQGVRDTLKRRKSRWQHWESGCQLPESPPVVQSFFSLPLKTFGVTFPTQLK